MVLLTAVDAGDAAAEIPASWGLWCLKRPCDSDELALAVERALETDQLKREVERVPFPPPAAASTASTKSSATAVPRKQVLEMVLPKVKLAAGRHDAHSGRAVPARSELIARAIHHESSRAISPAGHQLLGGAGNPARKRADGL
ncbi:MAG: hypothetical protein R2864_00215 [Syntrophotaleaceae bacterium]